jgi:mRNA interferase RelE/StbE
MASYSVEISQRARKLFNNLSPIVKPRIAEAITSLAAAPRPAGCKKLKDRDDWSLRVGDYRLLYTIDDATRVVYVTWIGPRGRAYRGN